ncbi:hypothetical protein ACQEV9_00175 [Streptomyces chartreusis]|uniref:hypothetical protein n=1 Tax=Streptomyces chartreusis TaxID=1969 RepID=UPI003D8F4EC7
MTVQPPTEGRSETERELRRWIELYRQLKVGDAAWAYPSFADLVAAYGFYQPSAAWTHDAHSSRAGVVTARLMTDPVHHDHTHHARHPPMRSTCCTQHRPLTTQRGSAAARLRPKTEPIPAQ